MRTKNSAPLRELHVAAVGGWIFGLRLDSRARQRAAAGATAEAQLRPMSLVSLESLRGSQGGRLSRSSEVRLNVRGIGCVARCSATFRMARLRARTVLVLAVCATAAAQTAGPFAGWAISTTAGNGTYAYVNGGLAGRALRGPSGLAVNQSSGDLFVVDQVRAGGTHVCRAARSRGIQTCAHGGADPHDRSRFADLVSGAAARGRCRCAVRGQRGLRGGHWGRRLRDERTSVVSRRRRGQQRGQCLHHREREWVAGCVRESGETLPGVAFASGVPLGCPTRHVMQCTSRAGAGGHL